MAALVTATDIVLALPIAFYMARLASPRTRGILVVSILLPLWSGYLVKVYAWRLILSDGGVLNAVLAPFGLERARLQRRRRLAGRELPLAAVHDHPDLRRARADPRLAARGLGRPGRAGGHDLPSGGAAAGAAGDRRRLDLHVQPDPGRLHHARRSSRTRGSSATSSTTSSAWPATSRWPPPTRWSRSRSCSSSCSSRAGSARSRRSDDRAARRPDRPARRLRRCCSRSSTCRSGSSSCTRSTPRAWRPGRSARSPSTGTCGRSATPGSDRRSLASLEAAVGATIVVARAGFADRARRPALPVLRARDDLVRGDPAARPARAS